MHIDVSTDLRRATVVHWFAIFGRLSADQALTGGRVPSGRLDRYSLPSSVLVSELLLYLCLPRLEHHVEYHCSVPAFELHLQHEGGAARGGPVRVRTAAAPAEQLRGLRDAAHGRGRARRARPRAPAHPDAPDRERVLQAPRRLPQARRGRGRRPQEAPRRPPRAAPGLAPVQRQPRRRQRLGDRRLPRAVVAPQLRDVHVPVHPCAYHEAEGVQEAVPRADARKEGPGCPQEHEAACHPSVRALRQCCSLRPPAVCNPPPAVPLQLHLPVDSKLALSTCHFLDLLPIISTRCIAVNNCCTSRAFCINVQRSSSTRSTSWESV